MKRFFVGLGYALAGLVLAVALTAGAYAIGGRELSRPARPVRLPVQEIEDRLVPSAPEPTDKPSPEDRASVDDKGGDNEGSDDNSGSGSSNSGSGSSNSGSGSSDSGSGSDDDEPDDD